MREVTMIGLDCATDDAKVGAALGKWRDGALSVQRVTLCDRLAPAVVVRGWLGKADEPVLLALDAPLGWRAPLAQTLVRHRAGDELSAGADQMFRRMTDRAIHKNVGKTPLDVGADRIARTAHAALRVLGELRRALSRPVPLAGSAHALGGSENGAADFAVSSVCSCRSPRITRVNGVPNRSEANRRMSFSASTPFARLALVPMQRTCSGLSPRRRRSFRTSNATSLACAPA